MAAVGEEQARGEQIRGGEAEMNSAASAGAMGAWWCRLVGEG